MEWNGTFEGSKSRDGEDVATEKDQAARRCLAGTIEAITVRSMFVSRLLALGSFNSN